MNYFLIRISTDKKLKISSLFSRFGGKCFSFSYISINLIYTLMDLRVNEQNKKIYKNLIVRE
jgi:hypothetical protein